MLMYRILIAGIPRSGKTTLARAIQASDPGYTHVPVDRYILPVPKGQTFVSWLRTSASIDWPLLESHLGILQAGRACFTPRADWKRDGVRISDGGDIEKGPGTKIQPPESGLLIEGSHAFSYPGEGRCLRIWIHTPLRELARRFLGTPTEPDDPDAVLKEYLGDNPDVLHKYASRADLAIPGTDPVDLQLHAFNRAVGHSED